MAACAAYGCTNRPSKHIPNISFHRFPSDEPRRSEWIKAIRRQNWMPTEHSRLCSVHFKETMIDRTLKRAVLSSDAVPTVFPAFPKHLQKVIKPRESFTSTGQEISNEVQGTSTNSDSYTSSSPSKSSYKRALVECEEKLETTKKKIKVLQQTKRRYKKRIDNLHALVRTLKEKRYLNDDVAQILEASAGHTKEIFNRIVAKAQGISHAKKFSPELRAFALTLHFYSAKAYRFVRKSFNLNLPHPRTLAKWYKHINGEPGFTAESFATVANKIKEAKYELLFCLTFDEMAIRQHIEFDGSSFHGYVNMGVQINDEVLPIAKESLVFLLTCVNEQWKIPLGYFLTDSVSSAQKVNLVEQCFILLHNINANVICLTFDGLPANLTMARILGCSIEPDNLKPQFLHPVTKIPISIFLDPSHMLKLIRNCLGDKKSIVDSDNNIIDWRYITELNKLQETEGLHLANKLRSSHINYFTKKMKVSLAAQVLSKSVADALEFATRELNLTQFAGCEATVRFIRIFNDLFDILNSHNTKQYGWKKAINRDTYADVRNKLEQIANYICGLRESRNGNPITMTTRKTGFLGFLICIKSTIYMMESLIRPEESPVVYLPTYKLSQDHIELFFSKIRLLGSCNNNPTARQFVSAYKKLLVKSQLCDSLTGNCLPLSSVSILHVCSNTPEDVINMTTNINMAVYTDDNSSSDHPTSDHDYMFSPSALSICSEHIVYYIAGFVAKKLSIKLKCTQCNAALFAPQIKEKSLTCYKSNGNLVYPSEDVYQICKKSESYFRKCVNLSGGKNLKKKYNLIQNSSAILKLLINEKLFTNLKDHIYDTEVMDNHYIHLLKAIINQYLKVRFHHFSKSSIDNARSIRQLYTKMILFKGQ